MMWRLLSKLPQECIVAVSGGADSIAVLHFLAKDNKRKIKAAMYDHNTGMHSQTLPIVKKLCDELNVELVQGFLIDEKPKQKSPEEFWRDKRYEWLESFDVPVITGHNLDDTIETYLWSCCNGNPRLIPATRNNIIRPFLAVSHQEMVEYCNKNNLKYFDDPANKNKKYARARVRYGLKQEAEKVNSGFRNMIKRMIIKNVKGGEEIFDSS